MKFTAKLGFAIGLAAVAAIVIAPLAIAGVVSSNHDMSYKFPTTNLKSGACSHCHIPHKAGGSKLWAQVTSVGTGWRAETISQLCYTCHGQVTYLGAREENPFAAGNHHGRTLSNLTTFLPAADIATFPTDVPLAEDGDLKCTSCHDVHSNEHRPFIRWETTAGWQFAQHCLKCHPRRANSVGKGTNNVINNYSQHPTEQAIANTARALFVTNNPNFNQVPGPTPQVPGVVGVANYNLGGHRDNGTATGNMTCATCHAVHANETDAYSAADGGSTVLSAIVGYTSLTVMEPNPITVAPYVAPVCTGCHLNSMTLPAGIGAGPGAATTYSHPISTLRSKPWRFNIDPTFGYKWGGTGGAGDAIVCQSCHDIHYGTPRSSVLYGTLDAPATSSNRNCVQCHDFAAVNHHPYNRTPPAAMVTAATHSTGPINWTTYARTASGAFTFPGGLMTCSTCHYQVGAHNNPGPFNGLTSYNINSEICVDCHSLNPSVYTTVAKGGANPVGSSITQNASHFIGNISTATYRKNTGWLTTGLSSKYATTGTGLNTTNGGMICESCHTLKMSGNLPGPTFSINAANMPARVRPTVGLLLEVSGNLTEDFAPSADLCTGCHGASPAGGNAAAGTATHPTISNGLSTITQTAITSKIQAAWLADGSVSLTASGTINCESCHRPHDAANGSGAIILEGVGTASNKWAGTAGNLAFDRTGYNGTGGNLGLRYAEEATFCNMCHNY